jgi:hypothetical protein
VKSIYEIRRTNLLLLKEQHGSWVKLNRALGRDDRDSTFSQIANAAPDSRTKRPRTMGDRQAREIEEALKLQLHAMDREDGIRRRDESPSPTARLVGTHYSAPGEGIDSRIADLLTRASPKSQGALERIAEAAAAGKLTEADLELLEQIAKRFEAK